MNARMIDNEIRKVVEADIDQNPLYQPYVAEDFGETAYTIMTVFENECAAALRTAFSKYTVFKGWWSFGSSNTIDHLVQIKGLGALAPDRQMDTALSIVYSTLDRAAKLYK